MRRKEEKEDEDYEKRKVELNRRLKALTFSAPAGKRRKRKKRKKKTPQTSSHSARGRARRRQRQCCVHGWLCCFSASQAVSPSFVGRPKLLSILISILWVTQTVQKTACCPQVQFLHKVLDVPVKVQRLVLWSRQCVKPS